LGFGRVLWTGCCGMLCLIPMAWISFRFLDLGSAVTGGLFVDMGDALDSLFLGMLGGMLGPFAAVLPLLINGIMGIISLVFFPLHWALWYRPDDISMAIAIILPWILCGTITSALFCKTAKKGFDTGLAVGVGYGIFMAIIPFLIQGILAALSLGTIDLITIFDGLFTGLTDLPYIAAVLTACLEGGLIGGVFGAFIGSLKYKPDSETTNIKKAKKKNEKEPQLAKTTAQPETKTVGKSSAGGGVFCPNCGTKVIGGDAFCPNCGTKV
jgi:hypothetical protein